MFDKMSLASKALSVDPLAAELKAAHGFLVGMLRALVTSEVASDLGRG